VNGYPSNGLTQIDISDPSHTMQTPGLDPLTARVFEKLPGHLFPASLQAHSLPPPTLSDSPAVDTTSSADVNTDDSDRGMDMPLPPMRKRGPPRRAGILKPGGGRNTTKTPLPVKVEEVEPDMRTRVCA